MKIVIAGCRDYNNYDEAKHFIDLCIKELWHDDDVIILSGCARGADAIGERYAKENNYKLEYYPAEWSRYGKGAGLKRNQLMAEACDVAICFWNNRSKGTKSMIDYIRKCDKLIFVKDIEKSV